MKLLHVTNMFTVVILYLRFRDVSQKAVLIDVKHLVFSQWTVDMIRAKT